MNANSAAPAFVVPMSWQLGKARLLKSALRPESSCVSLVFDRMSAFLQ